MRYFLLIKVLVLFLLTSLTPLEAKENKPRICLNMIVKNEKEVIERCLNSVKPLIDCWVIVDTGSTDGTQQIIKKCMQGIPGKLYERPWVNFAHNRNEALELGKERGEYLLFIDADDILTYAESYKKPVLDKDSYAMAIQHGGTLHYRTQLVRSALKWEWKGVVHEGLYCYDARSSGELQDVSMLIIGGGDRSQDPVKYLKDALLLEAALRQDPQNNRDMFYLAQSYKDAGIYELALKNFQRRVDMQGWDQEVFWSLYQIGIIHECMQSSSEQIIKAYNAAYQYRPSRMEPLYRLAAHYRIEGNFPMAYLLAQFGLKFPLPQDGLFVESWIYDYGLLFEYSISSYWVGEYEESLRSCLQLLNNPKLPESIREATEKNIEFAKQRLTERAIAAQAA